MKPKWYVLVPAVVLVLLIGWRVALKRNDYYSQVHQRAVRVNAPPPVTLASAQVRDIVDTFDETGTVEAPLNVKIAPKLTGRIIYLQLHEGDPVKKGQVLVKIDPRDVEGQTEAAKASLAEAQYRLAQAQLTQNPTNVGVKAQIREQVAGVTSAEANYNQTKQNYDAQVAAAKSGVTAARSKVNSAKANLEDAQAKLNRILDLYKQGFTAAQDVDDAKAAVAVQEAAQEGAEADQHSAEQQLSIVQNTGKANIAASKAALDQARASHWFAVSNTAQMPAYEQSIAALKASVAAAKGTLADVQSLLTDTVLVSPLDGFVTGRYADPGAVATSGMPIMAVQFMRNVWVSIEVPEEVSAKVHIGSIATVKLDALPDRTFTGSVIQFNPAADPQSRQFIVRIIVDNKQNLIKTGMFARVSIEIGRAHHVVTVPREAVRRNGPESFVYVVDGKSEAKTRPVTTGLSDPAYIAINSGLAPGERVVTMVANALKSGRKVSVKRS
jgi:RND family efflux transporter MFP subunit